MSIDSILEDMQAEEQCRRDETAAMNQREKQAKIDLNLITLYDRFPMLKDAGLQYMSHSHKQNFWLSWSGLWWEFDVRRIGDDYYVKVTREDAPHIYHEIDLNSPPRMYTFEQWLAKMLDHMRTQRP